MRVGYLMTADEHKTTLVGETVFVLQGFFPPHKDGGGQQTPGRWSTLYAWCFACGEEKSDRLSDETRKRVAKLSAKAQGYTGIPGRLNLHHDGLAYLDRADAHRAVAQIRKWNSCQYQVRVVRETVWKEVVIDNRAEESLQRPFYWAPGSAGDPSVKDLTAPAGPQRASGPARSQRSGRKANRR